MHLLTRGCDELTFLPLPWLAWFYRIPYYLLLPRLDHTRNILFYFQTFDPCIKKGAFLLSSSIVAFDTISMNLAQRHS
jgi:hypothetical protein